MNARAITCECHGVILCPAGHPPYREIEACDAKSAEILDLAARFLGNTDAARTIVQNAYNLGRVDGGYEQIARTCEAAGIPLGAEATVTQPRKVVA